MSGRLDGPTAPDRHLAFAVAPVAYFRGGAADSLGKLGRKMVLEVFVQRHVAKCSTKLNILQQHVANRANYFSRLSFGVMANRTETRQKLRRDNLAKLRKAHFRTSIALADKLGEGFSASYISQLLSGHRGIGDDVADKIEERLGLVNGYLDGADESDPIVAEFALVYRHATPKGREFLQIAIDGTRAAYLENAPASVHLSIVKKGEIEA